MRLLHAGLRDEPVGAATSAIARRRAERASNWPTTWLGNLCRCTGYRPSSTPAAHVRAARAWTRAGHRAGAGRAAPPAVADETFGTPRGRRFFAPRTLDAGRAAPGAARGAPARRLDRHRPVGQQAVPRPGRSDLSRRTWPSCKPSRNADASAHRRRCRWKTPGARSPKRWPALTDVWLRFASPPIRHAGTLGGNLIANGSPIGDGAPS